MKSVTSETKKEEKEPVDSVLGDPFDDGVIKTENCLSEDEEEGSRAERDEEDNFDFINDLSGEEDRQVRTLRRKRERFTLDDFDVKLEVESDGSSDVGEEEVTGGDEDEDDLDYTEVPVGRPKRRKVKVEKKLRQAKAPRLRKRKEKDECEKVPKKRGRKIQPRRLDGTDDITSEEEDHEEVPIRHGTGYHVLFKRKVLRYASTHSTRATSEKFSIKQRLVREWKAQKDTIELKFRDPSHKRPRSDGHTVEEKLQAIEFAKERSVDEASLLYNVDKSTIIKWRGMKDKLEARLQDGEGQCMRAAGSGRKPKFKHIEQALRDWIVGLRFKGVTVNTRMILVKAKKIIDENGESQNVRAPRSSSWVVGFLKRHNLYTYLGTTLGHEDPRELLAVESMPDKDISRLASNIEEIPENPNKRNRRRITMEDKLNIIERIDKGETQGAVAKSLRAATSTIQTIWSSRHEILQKSQNAPNKKPNNSLLWKKYSVIGRLLQDWCNNAKMTLDAKCLTEKAIELSKVYKLEGFIEDYKDWLKLFCKRRGGLQNVLTELTGRSIRSQRPTSPSHEDFPSSEPVSMNEDSSLHEIEEFTNHHSTNHPDRKHYSELIKILPVHSQNQQSSNHQDPSSKPQQTLPIATINQLPISGSFNTFEFPVMTIASASTQTLSETHLEAMKCIGYLRSWVSSNAVPNHLDLNYYLNAIETAVMTKGRQTVL